jgi:hypothetical protein
MISLVVKMEAIYSSETLVSTYKSTQPRNLQNHHAKLHGYENLKFLSIRFSNKNSVTIPCAFQTMVLFAMSQKKNIFAVSKLSEISLAD